MEWLRTYEAASGKSWHAYDALHLLTLWIVTSIALLSAVYHVDHGSWIWYQISGYNTAFAERFHGEIERTPAEFVKRHPIFKLDSSNQQFVILPRGEYSITSTIVFPKSSKLIIEPGAVLRMGSGCSLVSYSPIEARGTAREPIIFGARNSWFKWGVVGLVHTEKSAFANVHFENARQAIVNGIDFPGGLSLIETDAEVKSCQFREMFGKDALYCSRGHVLIQDNRIEVAFKDGIDLDDSSGDIRHNVLIHCDDEGIDLSDNVTATVEQNIIRDRHGGRIAATRGADRIRLANTLEFLQRD